VTTLAIVGFGTQRVPFSGDGTRAALIEAVAWDPQAGTSLLQVSVLDLPALEELRGEEGGQPVLSRPDAARFVQRFELVVSGFRDAALIRDGRTLLISDGSALHIVDVETGDDRVLSSAFFGAEFGPDQIAPSPVGDGFAVTSWMTAWGGNTRVFASPQDQAPVLFHTEEPTFGIAWSPDGGALAVAAQRQGGVLLFDVTDPARAPRHLEGSTREAPSAIEYSADGARILIQYYGSTARVWDIESASVPFVVTDIMYATFAADGRRLLGERQVAGPTTRFWLPQPERISVALDGTQTRVDCGPGALLGMARDGSQIVVLDFVSGEVRLLDYRVPPAPGR